MEEKSAAAHRIFKNGKVCIILAGRRAGKKCILLSNCDNGSRSKPYPHALCLVIDRPPRKVTRAMSPQKQEANATPKIAIKQINYKHLMPSRYVVSNHFDFKALLGDRNVIPRDELKNFCKEATVKVMKFIAIGVKGKNARDVNFLQAKLAI